VVPGCLDGDQLLNERHCTTVAESWQTTLTMEQIAAIVNRMQGESIVRPFDGSLRDAEGLLAVEKATFNESPYTAQQVQKMLSGDAQRAWLATGDGGRVVGFVVAFLTHGLRGPCWEIDLLAVHPEWTRRGLATRLIRAASSHGGQVADRARGVVSTENPGSARAFERAGFRPSGQCELVVFRPEDGMPRPWHALGVKIRKGRDTKDMEECAREAGWPLNDAVPGGSEELRSWTLLVAELHGRCAGCAELSEVQTLLYRGMWIESLAASRRVVRIALAHGALAHGASAGMEEIGMMVPVADHSLRVALKETGFRSLGRFDWYEAVLPLGSETLPGMESGQPGGNGV
jgi:ribosomal protein S18 acetylase RimI-like enzyme